MHFRQSATPRFMGMHKRNIRERFTSMKTASGNKKSGTTSSAPAKPSCACSRPQRRKLGDPIQYAARAEVLKALAHPSRLLIVDALDKTERCVCELQELVGSDMSTVSRHLSVLKSAGLVTDRKKGLNTYYSLAMPCILQFMDCITNVLEQRLKDYGKMI